MDVGIITRLYYLYDAPRIVASLVSVRSVADSHQSEGHCSILQIRLYSCSADTINFCICI